MSDIRIVLMTVPDPQTGERIARDLVDSELAACVSLVPGLTSIYRWKGEVHADAEVLAVVKTTQAVVERLLERAAELHPYDVPELVSLPVSEGYGPFLEWVRLGCGVGD